MNQSLWSDDDLFEQIDEDQISQSIAKIPKLKKPSPLKKKSAKWVSSAFDGFDGFSFESSSNHGNIKKKQLADHTGEVTWSKKVANKKKLVTEAELWTDKYYPQTQTDLAVHKKKIAEVETWLQSAYRHKSNHKTASILLLTGPAGAGKSATMQVLAKDLNFDVQEWSNPLTEAFKSDSTFNRDDFRAIEGFSSESQPKLFESFLLRSNKYQSLDIFGGSHGPKKVILIEEYPNTFFRDTQLFHNTLRKYLHSGRCPLVFIISDSSHGDSNERLLFPKQLQVELSIHNISFNAVAPTLLTKVLTKIASSETRGSSCQVPHQSTIDDLCASSAGDMRGAINALQFTCLMGAQPKSSVTMVKKKSTKSKIKDSKISIKSHVSNVSPSAVGARDQSLFLFRALGKILYCKRSDPKEQPDMAKLPAHLSHHYRDPLLVDPEDVIDRCQLSGEMYTAYLHQNYMDFFQDIDDVVEASLYISDSDHLTMDWTSRLAQQNYASSVSSRGLMFSNKLKSKHNSKSTTGFKPLHKPAWFGIRRKASDRLAMCNVLFRNLNCPLRELVTEVLPFLSLTHHPLHDPGQISFLHEMCGFTKLQQWQTKPDRLDEKDVNTVTDEIETLPSVGHMINDVITSSQANISSSQEKEDDVDISDYDDDF